jgi:hypothetical protein
MATPKEGDDSIFGDKLAAVTTLHPEIIVGSLRKI